MKEKKINIYEIAKMANVSIATVSRVINPEMRQKVAPDTLRKLDRLIEKYGYTPNLAAKSLNSQSTKTIGVVFPYLPGIFYSDYYNHILSAVSDSLMNTRYQFKLLLLKLEANKWDQFDFKAGERVDGLLITHWFKIFSKKSVLEKIKIPCIVINDIDKSIKTQFIGVDHYLGGQMAANHLYANGHRRISIIAGPDWSFDSSQRVEGFKNFFRKKGVEINPAMIIKADFLEHAAYSAIEKLLKVDPHMTAIFACNDQMAFGAMRRLKEIGISCPEETSVIGFDDEKEAQKSIPPLTTIRVPVYDLAKEATQILIKHLQSEHFQKPLRGVIELPIQLIQRNSVKNINPTV